MNKKEFKKVKKDYRKETERWKALKVGESVYLEIGRGFDFDYHEHKLQEINVNERYTMAIDLSVTPNKVVKLGYFSTVGELEKIGIKFKK